MTGSKIALLHGIGNRFLGDEEIAANWLPALNSGLHEAGYASVSSSDCCAVFYGSIFRPAGMRGGVPMPAEAEADPWLAQLLEAILTEAARRARANPGGADPHGEDPRIRALDEAPTKVKTRARAPRSLQAILRELSKSRFLNAAGTQRMLIGDLREVRLFLQDATIKAAILQRCEKVIGPDTRVLIAHSLGTVVAYEFLHRHPDQRIDTFVTLGSPLGIRPLVFDSLTPPPENGKGHFPNVRRWINIADEGDIVALQKRLAPFFGTVQDVLVYNGWQSHAATRYLTARETGEAIGPALA